MPAHAAADLFERTIEELGELRVVTASRRSEPLREAASSIYVITAEDIRRSGLSTIPEILRLAPGVEVARNGAHSWTISIRGFNSGLSNKLLVLIDGRSVYSPLYAGVFWDAQDTLLQDIERIEVISGPGGTLWGANAVNGVINIITRPASGTKGSLVELGTGDEQQLSLGFRHGFTLSGDMSARAYLKYTDRDASRLLSGEDGVDDVGMTQAGFRMDWDRDASTTMTLQMDNTLFASFILDERTDRTFSLFFQDQISLWGDRAFVTLGTKLEKNDYTDFEIQPNIRAAWNVADNHTLWAGCRVRCASRHA